MANDLDIEAVDAYLNAIPSGSRVTYTALTSAVMNSLRAHVAAGRWPYQGAQVINAVCRDVVRTRTDLIVRRGIGIEKL